MKCGDATGETATTRSDATKSNGTHSSYSRKVIEWFGPHYLEGKNRSKEEFPFVSGCTIVFCVKQNASVRIRM